jgi:hypothetical protein
MAVHHRCQSRQAGTVTLLQASPATLGTMAGPGELDSARLRRDLSLVLRRRLTLYAAIGAAGLTVVFSLIAATTAPGHATPPANPLPGSDPGSNQQPQAPIDSQPNLVIPAQQPQSGFGGAPVAISGGS